MRESILGVVDAVVDHLQCVVRSQLIAFFRLDVVNYNSSQRTSSDFTTAMIFSRVQILHRVVRCCRLTDFQAQVRTEDWLMERSVRVDLTHVSPISGTRFDCFVQHGQNDFTCIHISLLEARIFLVLLIDLDELGNVLTIECFM
ncbi:hypothetical protein D9M71_737590 [compost metagenome]